MGDEKISLENLLGSLERERRRAQSEADRLKKDNAILSERLKKLESREQKLSDQKDDILKKANEKAANILKDAKDQYDAAIRDLNKASVKGADISELEKKRRSLGEKTKGRLEKAAERPENTKSLVRPLKPEEIKEVIILCAIEFAFAKMRREHQTLLQQLRSLLLFATYERLFSELYSANLILSAHLTFATFPWVELMGIEFPFKIDVDLTGDPAPRNDCG